LIHLRASIRWIAFSEDDAAGSSLKAQISSGRGARIRQRVEDNTFHLGWRNLLQQRSDQRAFFGQKRFGYEKERVVSGTFFNAVYRQNCGAHC
jgi:hypothetical protein